MTPSMWTRHADPREPAAFLDKDGTLVENVPYNVDPARVRLLPGVLEGMRMLQDAGFRLVIVSNQPGIAFARFRRSALDRLEAQLDRLFAAAGVVVTAYAWCPHHPEGVHARYARVCNCRKPEPGLLLETAQRHRLDLTASWMIGDILDDVEAGSRAGCRTVLVDRGGETEWVGGPGREPVAIVHRFDAAASLVVRAHRAAGAVARVPLALS
jgi:D-glycero-D-manno-heptose 1,7-bisphosphate phosphatase